MGSQKCIVITGASSGIGAALAEYYAAPGVTLGLTGRSDERLRAVAAACKARGAAVETALMDVCEREALAAWLLEIDGKKPIDLVIANAGISGGSGGHSVMGEEPEQLRRIMAVNLDGVFNTVLPLIPLMTGRKRGQIALMSSLAGLRGLPGAPAYSTSKAAVLAYGQALRGWLGMRGVKVSVIMPGFVRTPLIAANPFPMPFILEPKRRRASSLRAWHVTKRASLFRGPPMPPCVSLVPCLHGLLTRYSPACHPNQRWSAEMALEAFCKKHGVLMLRIAFAAALLLRFAYVQSVGPMQHIFSDPGRHWENAQHFLQPYFFGSADPLMYQVYLAAVLRVTHGNVHAINLCTGLLCAAMAWFWYKALRELLPETWALYGGIIIALMPSLVMIYSYFMTETLLLTLMAAAVWLTLRAMRLKTLSAFAWAALVWALASYTRAFALPLALVSLGCMGWHDRRRLLLKCGMAGVVFGALAVPACWHSEIHLHYCAAFGLSYPNIGYYIANTKGYEMDLGPEGRYGFSSPSFYTHPFEPFSERVRPQTGSVMMKVNVNEGSAGWEREMARLRAQYGASATYWDRFLDNAVTLFFDPSWPDNNPDYSMGWLAIYNRWLWLPLALTVAWLGWPRRLPWNPVLRLPVLLALLASALLMFQQRGMMEGRYRKPAEPLLIAACVILLYERNQKRGLATKPK